jgi:starch synthase (maltosyl-transferring)
MTDVNHIRRENPALQQTGNISFCEVDNEQLLCYAKVAQSHDNAILVVVNFDSHHRQSGWIKVPLVDLGLADDEPYVMHDLLNGQKYDWRGARNYVELDPHFRPAHIFRVEASASAGRGASYVSG